MRKLLISVGILSVLLNVLFVFHLYQEKNRKQADLIDAVEIVLFSIDNAVDQLNSIDKSQPDYNNHIIAAMRDISESKSWIEAYSIHMPQNLKSWIGGIEVGLSNGAYGIDEEGFNQAKQDIKNFYEGYNEEAKSINIKQNPVEVLEKMEDVLSSQKYMGENYVNK